DLAGRCNAGNAVAVDSLVIGPAGELDEPQIAVSAAGDIARAAVGTRQLEFGDNAFGCDAADFARVEFREPDVPVGTFGESAWSAISGGNRKFRDLAIRRDAADAIAGK